MVSVQHIYFFNYLAHFVNCKPSKTDVQSSMDIMQGRTAINIIIAMKEASKEIAKEGAKVDLKALYKKLDADKKMVKLKALEFILEGNKTVGLDEILLREGFQSFPGRTQMESKRTVAHFEAFFQYMDSHGEEIQAKYLQQSSDSELMKEASTSDPHNYNFLLNKNSVSKFVRDEANHYQHIIDAYLQSTPDSDKAISTKKVSAFMAELFSSSHTAVLLNGKAYFGRAEVATELGGLLVDFGIKAKGLSKEVAQKPFMIEEEEVLDFLTHWLKQSCALNLYVLYARTASRLKKEVAFLANSQLTKQQQPIHPSRMTNEDFIAAQTAAESAPPLQPAISKEENQPSKQVDQPVPDIDSPISVEKEVKKSSPGQKEQVLRRNEEKSEELGEGMERKVEASKIPKQEGWKRQLKSLFEFGCKRRYKLSRLSTFQDIQLSTRTMDLEKFVYFCNFFELLDLMTRELITEYFRMHATERVIDYPRFVLIMEKLVKVNPKVGQRLQNKRQFQGKLKQNHIRKDMKLDRLSDYKFALRPINGKDVSSIQKELDYRRLEKAIARQEKDKSALNARQLSSRLPAAKNNRASKLSLAELEPIRDSGFNPEKLMVGDSQHDHLWQAYEAKIWKRQEPVGNTLQTILAKRMERGTQIITKMNSQRSFMQD